MLIRKKLPLIALTHLYMKRWMISSFNQIPERAFYYQRYPPHPENYQKMPKPSMVTQILNLFFDLRRQVEFQIEINWKFHVSFPRQIPGKMAIHGHLMQNNIQHYLVPSRDIWIKVAVRRFPIFTNSEFLKTDLRIQKI